MDICSKIFELFRNESSAEICVTTFWKCSYRVGHSCNSSRSGEKLGLDLFIRVKAKICKNQKVQTCSKQTTVILILISQDISFSQKPISD